MQNKVIVEAEYADIVIALLQFPYSINSVTKLVFMSFCVKNETSIKSYAHRTKDFVDTFTSNISIRLMSHPDELSVIFGVIKKLEDSDFVHIAGDVITLEKPLAVPTENRFIQFCEKRVPNPLIEVNKLDSKAFLEEVLRYV